MSISTQGCIFFKFFQVNWGRFSRHNIRVASQKEGEGKKKGKRGRKKGKRGKKKGKRGKKKGKRGRKRVREEEKRGRGEEKRCSGKGRKYFLRCWGRFSTVLCVEKLPQHLKR